MTRDQLKDLKVGDYIFDNIHSVHKVTKLYASGAQYCVTWKNDFGTFSQLKFVTYEELLMPYWRVMEDE